MRYLFFFLFMCCSVKAQVADSLSPADKQWMDAVNYTPVQYNSQTLIDTNNPLFLKPMNTLWKLRWAYLSHSLSTDEKAFVEREINRFVVACFLEKQFILLEDKGGFAGCPSNLVTYKYIYSKNVLLVNLCSGGCISDQRAASFIKIFNNRMEQLLSKKANS